MGPGGGGSGLSQLSSGRGRIHPGQVTNVAREATLTENMECRAKSFFDDRDHKCERKHC